VGSGTTYNPQIADGSRYEAIGDCVWMRMGIKDRRGKGRQPNHPLLEQNECATYRWTLSNELHTLPPNGGKVWRS